MTLETDAIRRLAVTNDLGYYEFQGVAPAGYRLEASLAGFGKRTWPAPVVLHPKECADLWIPPRVDRRLAGRVLDHLSRPAGGIRVELLPKRHPAAAVPRRDGVQRTRLGGAASHRAGLRGPPFGAGTPARAVNGR